MKRVDVGSLRASCDRFDILVKDTNPEKLLFCRPKESSAEAKYLAKRRAALGGLVPMRR